MPSSCIYGDLRTVTFAHVYMADTKIVSRKQKGQDQENYTFWGGFKHGSP